MYTYVVNQDLVVMTRILCPPIRIVTIKAGTRFDGVEIERDAHNVTIESTDLLPEQLASKLTFRFLFAPDAVSLLGT